MSSTPDASDPPDRPSSSSVSSPIISGSDGFDTPSRSRFERFVPRETSPGPDPLIIDYDIDVSSEYRSYEALRVSNNSADHGNAVSHPFLHDFSLSQGNSASDNGNGEDMTEEEFFAQLGEDVPEWAKQPPNGEPQVQDSGFTNLLEEDLEAQLDSELGAAVGNGPMDISEGDLEAQLDAELATVQDNYPTELGMEDLEAQLNAEIEAESHQEAAAEAARRKANLLEDMRIAAEKAALAVPCSQRHNPSSPTEEDLQAELNAGDAADGLPGCLNNESAVISKLKIVNRIAVKEYSRKRPKKKAKTAPNPKSKPGPPEARVGRGQPPPMRKPDELPQLYHHGEPDWDLLRKHMSLNTRVDLNHCYRSLGLDIGRGKAVYESLKEYLRTPGNSVDLSAKDVDAEDAKRIIANIAHKLLVHQRWGLTYFNQPSLASDCKFITFEVNSTEVFLEFTSLVYKAMKLEEKRKKGKAKQQEDKTAREVVQHPTSEAFATAATATYFSPRAVAQPLPPQAPTIAMANPRPVATQLQQQPPRRQAVINGVVVAPRSVTRVMPS